MKINKRFESKKEAIITLILIVLAAPFVYIFRGLNSGCEAISDNIRYFCSEFRKEFGMRISTAVILTMGWIIIISLVVFFVWLFITAFILLCQ